MGDSQDDSIGLKGMKSYKSSSPQDKERFGTRRQRGMHHCTEFFDNRLQIFRRVIHISSYR